MPHLVSSCIPGVLGPLITQPLLVKLSLKTCVSISVKVSRNNAISP